MNAFQGNLDYHQDMDGENFNKWADKAFKNLPPGSVIVMVSINVKKEIIRCTIWYHIWREKDVYSDQNLNTPFEIGFYSLWHKVKKNYGWKKNHYDEKIWLKENGKMETLL